MSVADIARNAGRFCEVVTRGGLLYGNIVRVSSLLFVVRPGLNASVAPRTVAAEDILQIRPLIDPR